MSDIHILDFYKDIGLTLAQLYSSFPKRIMLYVEDISGPDEMDEYGLHSDRHVSCLSAMIWLKDQGYIDYESIVKQESIDFSTLTEKSFLLLTRQANMALPENLSEDLNLDTLPPYAVKQAITNINLLRKALKSKSSINIEAVVFNLLEQS